MIQDGLLLINKAAGMTSHDVVARVRRILNTRSVGHCGTLDPMATGLMILLVGEATKISSYLLEQDKAYVVKAQLGLRTDTLDITGTVLEQHPVRVSPAEVKALALGLQGEFELNVPKFSAVKVQGEKMYEKARRQEEFETPKKFMKFYDVEVLDQGADWLQAKMRCSKGSYIRSWVELLGERAGTGAAMSELRRTVSEPFRLENAVTLEQLAAEVEKGGRIKGLTPLAETLPNWKTVRVDGQSLALIRNGQISKDLKSILISLFQPGIDPGVKVISKDGSLLALIGLEEGQGFSIRRVFRS